MSSCGGCDSRGAHAKWCRQRPGFNYLRDVLAEDANTLGDRIGANDPYASNMAYEIAARLRRMEADS